MPRSLRLLPLLLIQALPLSAQGQGEIELPRLRTPIRLDGHVEAAEWAGAAPLRLVQTTPAFGEPASEATEVLVGYDDGALYLACRCRDSRPRELRINSLYRDRLSGDDRFEVLIDGFNDNETGLWFVTNPAGVRLDRAISQDGNSSSDSWNAVWDAVTSVNGEGWEAELRIPLSSLGFQTQGEQVVLGLTVSRFLARTNERVTYPAIDPRFEYQRPSVMQDAVLRGVTPHRPVYLTPYLLGGVDRRAELTPSGLGYAQSNRMIREVGGDLRYEPSDAVHIDLTANTDFAQVEADDQQVNLTRFPLFYPEKRQFFQERAGLFDFDLTAGGRLFHSRQIGLAPDRTPIRMLGGARVVARTGGWDLGVLDVQTDRRNAIASENLGVARVRRRVFNPFSYAGGMVTSRLDTDGHHNVATGVDGVVRVTRDDYLTLRGAATFDDAQTGPSLLDRSQLFLAWERRANLGLSYFAQFHRVGQDYLPDLGFLPRTDFTRGVVYYQYLVQPRNSALHSHGPGAIAYAYFRNRDGTIESSNVSYWWSYNFRSGWSGWAEMVNLSERVPSAFELGDGVMVQSGSYRYSEGWFNLSPPSGRRLRMGLDARVGGFYDGWRIKTRLTPTWNLSRHLELGGSYEINRIRFPDRDTGVDIHLAGLRIGTAVDARLSTTGLIQYNSVDQRLGVNLRLRYNFREGSDLWLVYDEGLNTESDAGPGVPQLPRSASRALRLKLTHTIGG